MPGPGAYPQSLEPGTLPRRIERGQRGGGRQRHVPRGARHPDQWLDHPPRELLQRFASDLAAVLDATAATAGPAGPVIALSPATVSSAPPLAERSTGDPRFNAVWSFSGLPTCGVPACLGGDGLPLSLQLGAARESFALFQAAAWCEAVLAFPGGG